MSISLRLLLFCFSLSACANEGPDIQRLFVAAVSGSVTGFLCLSHVSLLYQIKAQGCRKSSVHSVLSSKLAGDVAQLKQKAPVKRNLSGTGSRDKEGSPCSLNLKHAQRSQGGIKGESRRESGGQSDTGTYFS